MVRLFLLLIAFISFLTLSTYDFQKKELNIHQLQDVVISIKQASSSSDLNNYPVHSGQVIDEINGMLVADYEKHKIDWVPLDRIPKDLRNAVIAIEDSRFYQHEAFDFRGIVRALWVNLKEREFAEGGSTITQQLAKNLFLTHDKTIARKVEELILAKRLEDMYRKDQILEMYLNQIYFGHGAYGVERASMKFFGKKVTELNLAEATLLAGVIKGPGFYSPLIDKERSQTRQGVVLQRMVELGFITPQEKEEALLVAAKYTAN